MRLDAKRVGKIAATPKDRFKQSLPRDNESDPPCTLVSLKPRYQPILAI